MSRRRKFAFNSRMWPLVFSKTSPGTSWLFECSPTRVSTSRWTPNYLVSACRPSSQSWISPTDDDSPILRSRRHTCPLFLTPSSQYVKYAVRSQLADTFQAPAVLQFLMTSRHLMDTNSVTQQVWSSPFIVSEWWLTFDTGYQWPLSQIEKL